MAGFKYSKATAEVGFQLLCVCNVKSVKETRQKLITYALSSDLLVFL